jgi:putative lipoic acid-binding regulatory protein
MIDKKEPELEFPLDCHFKVIAEDLENMHFVIETVLMGLGVSAPLTEGNKSGGGKYISFNITVRVKSREQMNQIDSELRNIQGVKMVL